MRNWKQWTVVCFAFAPWPRASAQQVHVESAVPLTVPVRPAGTLHLSTNTRTGGAGSLGTLNAVYNNTCLANAFVDASAAGTVIVDEGRIPTPSSTAGPVGDQTSYGVSAFELAYATRALDPSVGGGGAHLRVRFFETYQPCAPLAITPPPIASFDMIGLPGTEVAGALAAYAITIDLSGMEFCLRGDGEGAYDGDPNLDSFGYALEIVGETVGTAGFLLAGPVPAGCPMGDGTRFQNPAALGSGLDDFNFLRRENVSPGCIFFGGNPYAGVYFVVHSAILGACTPPGGPFCFGVGCPCGNDDASAGCRNSTGHGALLEGSGSNLVGADDLVLTCTGLPANSIGLFFMAPGQQASPPALSDGLLCTDPGPLDPFMQGIVRLGVRYAEGAGAISFGPGVVARVGNVVQPGTTRSFQVWYRNPPGPCMTRGNTSNGYAVAFR